MGCGCNQSGGCSGTEIQRQWKVLKDLESIAPGSLKALAEKAIAERGDNPGPPDCLVAPPGSSVKVQLCYTNACYSLQVLWNACRSDECRNNAVTLYNLEVGQCDPS